MDDARCRKWTVVDVDHAHEHDSAAPYPEEDRTSPQGCRLRPGTEDDGKGERSGGERPERNRLDIRVRADAVRADGVDRGREIGAERRALFSDRDRSAKALVVAGEIRLAF